MDDEGDFWAKQYLIAEPLKWSAPQDRLSWDMQQPIRVSGFKYVCSVPTPLGPVIDLRIQAGRVVASTQSGIDFIVPKTRTER